MKTRERRAVGEMKSDPSKSPCRRRLQRTSASFSKGTTVNEAQRHLMKIAATNPFLLVQLSPVPMHLKARRDLEAKREQAERDRRERIELDSLWLQLGHLEFVD